MRICKANNFIDAYRARASSSDINSLSGRDGQPSLTLHVNSLIVSELRACNSDKIVDIGCGDGTLLRILLDKGFHASQVRGVLPTDEEVRRVSDHLMSLGHQATITLGKVDSSGLPEHWASHTVCNGVFLLLKAEEVRAALMELIRITRPGGCIMVGELPDLDERTLSADRALSPIDTSALQRAASVLLRYGPLELFRRIYIRLRLIKDDRLVVIAPSTTFWARCETFEALAAECGLLLQRRYRSPSLDFNGRPIDLDHRWNYLFLRP